MTTNDEQSQMVDDISSILMRGRYGRKGVGRPSDNPIDLRDARRIVEYVAARDARVRRDAAREALDGLADDFDMWHQDMPTDEVARRIRHEMKLLHPEEETP